MSHASMFGLKYATQLSKGKIMIKDLNATDPNAVIAEVWVSDDPALGYRVEYWVFYPGYEQNNEPGPNHPDVTFRIEHRPFDPDIGGDDVSVFAAFKDYLANTLGPQGWEKWLRASCVVQPTMHLCP
jgi:hypothetical protein